ncbi:hypothetical protein K502DRAFT_365814 [Neoconidiobolus thromboides FSU 785]|nr:hypothetical protein K502DRAFT_365814 [Neoconidiobolus thromboides FSU 785]
MVLKDLRKESLKDSSLKVKFNIILTSFQLLFFSSTVVVVQFVLITVIRIIDRETFKEAAEKETITNLILSVVLLIFNTFYLVEVILQLFLGFGITYLKNIWCVFDLLLIIFLIVMEVLLKLGWKDITYGAWRFLVVLRLLRVLALMAEYTSQLLIEKKDKREALEGKINEIRMDTINEDIRNSSLKEQLRLAVLKLCKVEKHLVHSKKDAEVLTRRYSTAI